MAANEEWGIRVISMLLSRDRAFRITEAIMVAAAGNRASGNKMVLMLLAKYPTVRINEPIVVAAAGNWAWGKELFVMLAEHTTITITGAVVAAAAAAGNLYSGKEVMTALLSCGTKVRITREAAFAMAENVQLKSR